MEKYLEQEYGMVEISPYEDLETLENIKSYFKNEWYEWFRFETQGEFWEDETVLCTCDDRYFSVFMKVEYWGAKQDRGDKRYTAERLTKLEITEIEKPQPKERNVLTFTANMTKYEADRIRETFNSFGIEYKEDIIHGS